MTTRRIGVIGLGQRIAHVLAAMKEVGWDLRVDGYVDLAPIGARRSWSSPVMRPGRAFGDAGNELLAAGPYRPGDDRQSQPPAPGAPDRGAIAAGAIRCLLREAGRAHRGREPDLFGQGTLAGRKVAPPVFIGLVMRSMPRSSRR